MGGVITSKDIRNRYYFQFEKDGQIIWEGYLLHDEAWIVLKSQSSGSVSMTWSNNISTESDECLLLKD